MKILRYTEDVQKQISSKVKPEPWLHIGIADGQYAIWVWDTRQIVGTGKCSPYDVVGTPAKDNRKPLSGQNAENFSFERQRKQRASRPASPNDIDACNSGQEFKERLRNWRYITPAQRRGCVEYAKGYDAIYGKGNHSYGSMLKAARKGLF